MLPLWAQLPQLGVDSNSAATAAKRASVEAVDSVSSMAATAARNPTVAMAAPVVDSKSSVVRDVATADPMSTRFSEAMTHPSTVLASVENHPEASVRIDHPSVASVARVASREDSQASVTSEISDNPVTLAALDAAEAPEATDLVDFPIPATSEILAISATLRASAILVD